MRSGFLGLLICMIGLPAFGVGHKLEIDSKLYFRGKKVASPRILTHAGEKAKVIMSDQKNDREYNLEVFPKMDSGEKVNLHYSLAVKEENNETITRGEVKMGENNNARIMIDHGRIQIHLKVKKS